MEYESKRVKSYLTYYMIADSLRFYDNSLAINATYGSDYPIIALGEDIVRKFKFCTLMCGTSELHPCSYISFPNEDAMREG